MNSASTKGNSPVPPQREPAPATSARVLRQAAVIVVVVVIWSALLVGYLALTDAGKESETTSPQPGVTTVPTDPPAALTAQPPTPEPEATLPPPAAMSFVTDVLPVFAARCERCHSGTQPDAGLSVSSHAAVMAGSEDGPVVIPGDAAASRLVQVIRTGQMPRRAPKLPDAEIQTISDWVDAGAPDN